MTAKRETTGEKKEKKTSLLNVAIQDVYKLIFLFR